MKGSWCCFGDVKVPVNSNDRMESRGRTNKLTIKQFNSLLIKSPHQNNLETRAFKLSTYLNYRNLLSIEFLLLFLIHQQNIPKTFL